MTLARKILTVFIGVLLTLSAFAWATGRSSSETVRSVAIGFIFIAAFYFVVTLLTRLPFQRLRAALASLLTVVLVLLGVLYAMPFIEQYRYGDDVSHSLFHPLVFAGLGVGILLLTARR